MFRITAVLIFLLWSGFQISAQNPGALLKSKKSMLFEKLFLHVDREIYAPGDMIWLKAYQVNGITHQLNSNYRNIFVELVSDSGKIVDDLMLFSINGQASGEFKTDNLPSGGYTIRAHTKFLEHFGEEALFYKKIWIRKTMLENGLIEKPIAEDSKIAIDFLPEGGNLVLNAANNMAFKAINQKGRGVPVSGKIVNDLGDTIGSFSTTYLGMGKFLLIPLEDRTYYAVVDHHPELKIKLPSAKSNGICMKYKECGDSLMFEFSTNMKQKIDQPFYFKASYKGNLLVSDTIQITGFSQTLALNKHLFPTGISKVTLLDMAQNPVAERMIFVDHDKNDRIKIRMKQNEFIMLDQARNPVAERMIFVDRGKNDTTKMNQKEFKPRVEVKMDVEFNLDPGDTITSTLSVSVVNRSFFSTGEETQNIKSYLLLDSDLKGAIESQASYFIDDESHTSAEKLDLLMLVHGWRTYLWDDVAQIPTPSLADWNDAGINISGYVKRFLWKGPAPEAEISLDYAFKNFQIGKTTADKNGRFLFKNIYLLETLRVMFNAKARDGTRNAEIILDPVPKKDSVVGLAKSCFDIDLNSDFMRRNYSRRIKELDFNPEFGSILLGSVDIIKKKNNAIMRSYGAYPWADKTLTITRDDYRYFNLLDYLKYKLPSLTDNGDEVQIKGTPVDIMVDGLDSYYSFNEMRTLRMNEIATIDIVNPGFRSGFSPGTLGVVNQRGLIAIYKKAIPDVMQSDIWVKGRIMPIIKAYKLPGKFYSPEYTLENLKSPTTDVRSTLYWNPDVQYSKGKSAISFFTSDVLADYVVYLEGITRNGKICFGTTSFTVNKK